MLAWTRPFLMLIGLGPRAPRMATSPSSRIVGAACAVGSACSAGGCSRAVPWFGAAPAAEDASLPRGMWRTPRPLLHSAASSAAGVEHLLVLSGLPLVAVLGGVVRLGPPRRRGWSGSASAAL